jgi:3,4-dihydroxy 2-butanone 4-phosphate synthase/GTP cyclohydrolase II
MNDDGTMARLPDLVPFAQFHGLKIATIADLIAYRRRYDRVVERTLTGTLESRHGGTFKSAVYVDKTTGVEHIALWKGDLSAPEPVLVRVHALNLLDDALGDLGSGKAGELQAALRMIGEAGRGVVVLIREPMPTSLSTHVRGHSGLSPAPATGLRDIGVGAQILLDLGVRDMIVLSNSQHTYIGLEGYGLRAVDWRPIAVEETD